MTIALAILGLAFLILIHEAGHFFTAQAVGMKPRKFYIGFPPAVAKVRRKGVEYGIGAIPLGGYVKVPGHAPPAPSDLDVHLGRALAEAPQLSGPIERVKRALAAGDMAGAQELLGQLEAAVTAAELTPAAERSAQRGLTDLRDGLGDDAYWRQRTWKRVAFIFAGPAANLALRGPADRDRVHDRRPDLDDALDRRGAVGLARRSRPGCGRTTRSSPSTGGRSPPSGSPRRSARAGVGR